ncbi:MAG: hypothetical protein ABEH38_00650 [Flavobacteriales bacterium]
MGTERTIKALLTLGLGMFTLLSNGQEETRGIERRTKEEAYSVPDSLAKKPDPRRVLVIPYKPSRYSNELEREIKTETGLKLRQIRKRIRFGLDTMLLKELWKEHQAISYVRENDPDRNFELKYVYRRLGYKYRPVPKKDLQRFKEKDKKKGEEDEKGFLGKLFQGGEEKKEAEKDTGAGRDVMSEGQIKDKPDERIRYMDAVVREKGVLNYLSRKYGVKYLLFINQLDLMPRKDQPVKLAAGTHGNLIKVHYSIMTHNGKKIHGGAAFVSYPSSVNDLNGLIKGYFPKVADQVVTRLEEKNGEP